MMPKPGFVSLNIRDDTYERLEKFCENNDLMFQEALEKCWDDYQRIMDLDAKIKTRPEQVRRYT